MLQYIPDKTCSHFTKTKIYFDQKQLPFYQVPFSLEHKISRKKQSDRHIWCFCGSSVLSRQTNFISQNLPFYREKIAVEFVQKLPFDRIPILSRMYCGVWESILVDFVSVGSNATLHEENS